MDPASSRRRVRFAANHESEGYTLHRSSYQQSSNHRAAHRSCPPPTHSIGDCGVDEVPRSFLTPHGDWPDTPPPSYSEVIDGVVAPSSEEYPTFGAGHFYPESSPSRQFRLSARRAAPGWPSAYDMATTPATQGASRDESESHDLILDERVYDVWSRIDEYDFHASGEDDDNAADSRRRRRYSNDERGQRHRSSRALLDFSKTWQYANSRLPPHLMPMRLYLSTWALVCLAAQASVNVYNDKRPRTAADDDTSRRREDHIPADRRAGTKAMTVQTCARDTDRVIVVAIRGSQWTTVDWTVNCRTAPTAPTGFLDDEGNACHGGFLAVARATVAPLAARLAACFEQDPARCGRVSLVLTGHSAGGAVASLLYMHLRATRFQSPLNYLAPFFRRIHCVTFGAPPVALLPLQAPSLRTPAEGPAAAEAKSFFLAFANEGDPVVRADRQYVGTLTRLLRAPNPSGSGSGSNSTSLLRPRRSGSTSSRPPTWPVPPATLSNAGRLVLLRIVPGRSSTVEAVQVVDRELREVVFGDPAMHSMVRYQRRVERLAIAAVTGGAVD